MSKQDGLTRIMNEREREGGSNTQILVEQVR